MIDLTKDNFTQPLSIKEILDELKISKDVYRRSLSTSKDENLQLHLIYNNHFDIGLKPWQENIDIQPFLMSMRQ